MIATHAVAMHGPGTARLENARKQYNVAKDHGQRAIAELRDNRAVRTPPPPTPNGKAYHAKLVQILQGRKLVALSAEEKAQAHPLLKQVGEEWQMVLATGEKIITKLWNLIEHHRDQHRRVVKQADKVKKADRLLPRAEAQLSLVQRRTARFEGLGQLFNDHQQTLRSRSPPLCPAVRHTEIPTLDCPVLGRLRERSKVLYVRGCAPTDGSASVLPGTEARSHTPSRRPHFCPQPALTLTLALTLIPISLLDSASRARFSARTRTRTRTRTRRIRPGPGRLWPLSWAQPSQALPFLPRLPPSLPPPLQSRMSPLL